ncbi:MAG: hypothetical protein GY799_16075 [Desulfobulbaceae bacterium]|nr:hypothetical protein [Desulfobulbaceae bacterium]
MAAIRNIPHQDVKEPIEMRGLVAERMCFFYMRAMAKYSRQKIYFKVLRDGVSLLPEEYSTTQLPSWTQAQEDLRNDPFQVRIECSEESSVQYCAPELMRARTGTEVGYWLVPPLESEAMDETGPPVEREVSGVVREDYVLQPCSTESLEVSTPTVYGKDNVGKLLIRAFSPMETKILQDSYLLPGDYKTHMEALAVTFWGHYVNNKNHSQPHPALPVGFENFTKDEKVQIFFEWLEEIYPTSLSTEEEFDVMRQHYGLLHLWKMYSDQLLNDDFLDYALYFAAYKIFRYGNQLIDAKGKGIWARVVAPIVGESMALIGQIQRSDIPLDLRKYYVRKTGIPLKAVQMALSTPLGE